MEKRLILEMPLIQVYGELPLENIHRLHLTMSKRTIASTP